MTFPEGTVPLTLGTTLALSALSLVLWPLMARRSAPLAVDARVPDDVGALRAPRQQFDDAIRALRETAWDQATGKLNDHDAARLGDQFTRVAIFAMRQGEGLAAAAAAGITDADIEDAIRRAATERPTCRHCGVRPEPDAMYCSNCGHYLPDRCATCQSDVTMPASRYCATCGVQLSPV